MKQPAVYILATGKRGTLYIGVTSNLREKQLKKWSREWKLRLVQESNPDWRDLWNDIVG
jgi:putative endonuclease